MKLQDSLYHITSKNVGESYFSYDIELEASHTNYKVNSQGVLVMPGVCIMLIAKELLEDAVSKLVTIRAVKNVMFFNELSPVEMPHITYTFKLLISDPTTHIVKIIANVSADGIQLANMSFTCKQN